MSLDNTLTQQSGIVDVVSLATSFLHAPFLSDTLVQKIHSALASSQSILLFYNRRGHSRVRVCQDCGFFPTCPFCDIAYAYHTNPVPILVCHHCSHREMIVEQCPNCKGYRFQSIGIGIQQIESDLMRIFSDVPMVRIDSDEQKKRIHLHAKLQEPHIILATYSHIGLVHLPLVHEVAFLHFDSELSLPDYRMEEELYHTIDFAKKSGKNLTIQTWTPNHSLLQLIVEGNYKDFLRYMSDERKQYHYPPYGQFCLIRIHHKNKELVQDIVSKLVNKIEILKKTSTFLAYDQDIWEKHAGEWVQKIILKEDNLEYLIQQIEVEIVKNRSVTLEWR